MYGFSKSREEITYGPMSVIHILDKQGNVFWDREKSPWGHQVQEGKMILQAYKDGKVCVFRDMEHLFSFSVRPPQKSEVDKHLKKLRMERRTTWEDAGWGVAAEVRFRGIK